MTLVEAQTAGIAPWNNVVREDFHIVVYADKYPCTPGHLLFVPQYNSEALIKQCFDDAFDEGQRMIEKGTCTGFNVGINWGKSAGQTVMYPHVHLIPRRDGDVEDPVGGVRNTIPGKGNYKK